MVPAAQAGMGFVLGKLFSSVGGQNILEQHWETEKSCACSFLNSRQAPETLTFHFHKGQQMSWMTITHMAS